MKDEKALSGGRSVAPGAPATPRSVASLRVDEFPWRIIMGITARHTQTYIDSWRTWGPDAFCRCRDYGNEVETIAVALRANASLLAFRMFPSLLRGEADPMKNLPQSMRGNKRWVRNSKAFRFACPIFFFFSHVFFSSFI